MDHEVRAAAAAAAVAALSESGHASPNQDLKLSVWASTGIIRCRKNPAASASDSYCCNFATCKPSHAQTASRLMRRPA